jgi:hypothetical protein
MRPRVAGPSGGCSNSTERSAFGDSAHFLDAVLEWDEPDLPSIPEPAARRFAVSPERGMSL